MRELIKKVAEIIRDLETLNLVQKNNITTTLKIDENNYKYILTVRFTATDYIILDLCQNMFQKLVRTGYTMSVTECHRADGVLSIAFFEP